jgi:hypothetical protein
MVRAVSEGKCKIEIKLYVWVLTYYIIMCGTCTLEEEDRLIGTCIVNCEERFFSELILYKNKKNIFWILAYTAFYTYN